MGFATALVVALAAALAGCAHGDRNPSAMTRTAPVIPTGVWHGTISGHEMVDPNGMAVATVELTLKPDGMFVLADSSGARATGQTRIVGNTLVLTGAFVAPASRAGEPVMERLRPGRDGALYGTIDTLFRGLKVTGNAALSKVS